MSKRFLVNINMGGNQIVSPVLNNAIVYGTGTDPGSATAGTLYYNTSTNLLKYWNGTSWQALSSSGVATSVANALSTGTGLSYTTGTSFDGSAARTINLANTSVTAGSYGSSTQIPTFTVDAQGRLTAAGTAAISTSITLAGTATSGTVSTGGTLTITAGSGITSVVSGSTFTITNTGVLSVNGSTGAITGIATLASPTFTGTVTVPATGIVYPGSTSGQSILAAPATAGTNTAITLPATAGTLALNNQTFYLGSTPITINQSTGTITSITGLSITGNSGTATTLATSRNINGVAFNGSADITIKASTTNQLTIGTGLSGTSFDGSGAVTIANTGVTSIAGTTNQITASASTGGVTLSLPQSINTTATPTFNQITLNNAPSNASDAVTKQYVDNIASGINAHDAVIAATTAALTVTYNNNTTGIGATLTNAGTQAAFSIDNVTLNSGDRVLVKNQASSLQNGVYTVTTVGTGSTNWVLTRATDYDQSTAGEVAAGDTVFVVAPAAQLTGTPVNQNTGWTMNSAGTITIGTSAITFAQSSGTGTVTATNGLTIVTGNQVGVNLGSAFDATTGTGTSGLSISGGTLQVRLSASGGLTSSTAGLALNTPGTGLTISGNSLVYASGTTTQSATGVSGGSYTYATQKQVATITLDGTTTSWIVAHNLNSRDIQVQIYQTSSGPDTQYSEVEADIVRTSTSSVTITFAAAGTSGNSYNIVMLG